MNKIVVFGGSFNPPLNSHFSIAQNVLNQFDDVEKIVFIPLNKKYGKNGMIENEHRYNMLKLVADKNDEFEVSRIDIDANRSLYSFEHLDEIQKNYPNKELLLLIGSDNLKEFSSWRNPEFVLSNYKILVMTRDTDNIEAIINDDELLKKHKDSIITINEDIRSNYSSTYVRKLLQENKSIRYLVPDEVYQYIKKNHLYQ